MRLCYNAISGNDRTKTPKNKGDKTMFRINNWLLNIVKLISSLVVMASLYSACSFMLYQEELPESVKQLRRF